MAAPAQAAGAEDTEADKDRESLAGGLPPSPHLAPVSSSTDAACFSAVAADTSASARVSTAESRSERLLTPTNAGLVVIARAGADAGSAFKLVATDEARLSTPGLGGGTAAAAAASAAVFAVVGLGSSVGSVSDEDDWSMRTSSRSSPSSAVASTTASSSSLSSSSSTLKPVGIVDEKITRKWWGKGKIYIGGVPACEGKVVVVVALCHYASKG